MKKKPFIHFVSLLLLLSPPKKNNYFHYLGLELPDDIGVGPLGLLEGGDGSLDEGGPAAEVEGAGAGVEGLEGDSAGEPGVADPARARVADGALVVRATNALGGAKGAGVDFFFLILI
jgi:hypothetical protein